MTLPANRIANVRRRVNRARKFPDNTCPASRHLHRIADYLARPKRTHALESVWDAEHMAGTMYSVLESLWKARTRLAKRKAAP